MKCVRFSRFLFVGCVLLAGASKISAQTVELISFNIVELRGRGGHENYLPIYDEPILGTTVFAKATVSGPFDTAEFTLVSPAGDTIKTINLEILSPAVVANGMVDFFGSFELPTEPFKVVLSGIDQNGTPYSTEGASPRTFTPRNVGVRFERTFYSLPAGTTPLRLSVTNYGTSGLFDLQVTDNKGFISGPAQFQEFINANDSASFIVFLAVPKITPEGTVVNLSATAKSATDANITNTAKVDLPVEILGNISLSVDIKPGSCDNPINPDALGALPVVIYGTDDFDVRQIDTATVFLGGSAYPTHTSFEDVGTPGAQNCGTTKKDKKIDLVLQFSNQEIRLLLENFSVGTKVIVPLSAQTTDGMALSGQDIIRVQK